MDEEAVDLQALWDSEASAREKADAEPQGTPEPAPADPTPEPAAAAPAEPEADPYAGLHPKIVEQLKQIDALSAANSQLQHKVSSAEGRVAAMQRELGEAKKAQVQTSAGPSNAELAAAAKSPEQWEQLKADFPEWGSAVEAFVNSKLPGAQPVSEEQITALLDSRQAPVIGELKTQLNKALVEIKHEGWEATVKTDAFKQWLVVQDEATKSLAASDEPRDAVSLLSKFKASQEKPARNIKQERQGRLEAAASPRRASAPAAKSEEELTPEEIWNLEAHRREKQQAARGY
jgi:hypothetical protein